MLAAQKPRLKAQSIIPFLFVLGLSACEKVLPPSFLTRPPPEEAPCPEFPDGSRQDKFLCHATDILYGIQRHCSNKRSCYHKKGIDELLKLCNERDLEKSGFHSLQACDSATYEIFRELLPKRTRIRKSSSSDDNNDDSCPPPSQCFQNPSSCPKKCPAEGP